MGYAHFHTPWDVVIDPEPGMYCLESEVHDEDIVGWAIWFSDGSRFCSLSTSPDKLPKRDVQILLVWHFKEGRGRQLYRMNFTRHDYAIPNSEVHLKGDWTSWSNHDKISKEAFAEHWPPSWETP